uniref:hypothetical protein n=1 Tax=Escherichia coli TaxID=562 RepID=UPI003B018853
MAKAKVWFAEQEEKSQAKGDEKQHRHRMTKSALTFTGIPAVAIFLSLTGKNKMRVRGGFKSASDARKYI